MGLSAFLFAVPTVHTQRQERSSAANFFIQNLFCKYCVMVQIFKLLMDIINMYCASSWIDEGKEIGWTWILVGFCADLFVLLLACGQILAPKGLSKLQL